MNFLKAAWLSLLPAVAWTQGLLPCHPETQARTVATNSEAATLASSVQCANGSFIVEWHGDVVLSHTIHIAQGTSVTITGATTGATVDGNHKTQLFTVDGSSSLHLTDLVLVNGNASLGGAIRARDQSSVSFGGNVTFASNTAGYGGAIYADQSTTVFWDGEKTIFRSNYAFYDGGAILVGGSSYISWDGVTAFSNNSARYDGGSISLTESSQMSWTNTTRFVENSAESGGAIHAAQSTISFCGGEDTIFRSNYASYIGGAIAAGESSYISWDGVTVFVNNSADFAGGAICFTESSEMSWANTTTFADNTAVHGGAIFVHSSTVVWDGDHTRYINNYATSVGGAIAVTSGASVSWHGEMSFSNNSAGFNGGAIYTNFSSVMWDGNGTTFSRNYVSETGGAILAEYSTVSWGGETVFVSNHGTRGGALCVSNSSNILWTGNTTFQNNSAKTGGGLSLFGHSTSAWSGTTTFAGNTAITFGGALDVSMDCTVSWTDTTTFSSNIASSAGAMFVLRSNISWTGNTVFTDNIANLDGGAMYFILRSYLVCRGTTTFRNNTATTGNGGALGIFGVASDEGPELDISGVTTFMNNSAFASGGAVLSFANRRGQYFEGVVFRSNSANIGGAIATFGTGNGDDIDVFPTIFSRCEFISNTAIETGGAVQTAFGREEFISTRFENNAADIGGALNLGGETVIFGCSLTANMALNSGLAVLTVGSLEIHHSSFQGNVLFCDEGDFLEESLQDSSNTPRYDSVCRGCPPWNDCHNCTISDINSVPVCSVALEHTTSAAPGTTLETLSVDSGYWRATRKSSTIRACYNAGSCLGGQTGGESFCDDGYVGPYCSVCQSGYSSSFSSTCTRCSSSRRQWFVVIAAVAGIVAVCAIAAFSGFLLSTSFDERESTSIYSRMLRKLPVQALKSVIVIWQILTQFTSVANITYPGVYQTFMNSLAVINLDIGFVASAGCLWSGIDFHDRLIADTIWPLAVLGLLAMTYQIALHRNSTAVDGVREKIRNKHLSAVLFLLFMVYSSVSSTVFRMFACDDLDDGEEYLRADYRIMCTDAKYKGLQVYAAVMIAVYPVGIPLLFGVLLYRHRVVLSDILADKTAAQSMSSLWAPYRPSCFYYEIVECARRIMLTGVVVFIYPNDTAQIAITIINSFFFFVVSEALSPYKSVSDTWLSRFGHVLICFSMFDVLLLKVDASQESSESQRILAGVLVAGHVVMIGAVVAEAISLCYASIQLGDDAVEEPNPFQSALRVRSSAVKTKV